VEWIRDQFTLIGGYPGIVLTVIWWELYMLRREIRSRRKKH
jgi:hypothetical protein